jgi:hypothetical protein
MKETNKQWAAAQQGSSETMTMIQREREIAKEIAWNWFYLCTKTVHVLRVLLLRRCQLHCFLFPGRSSLVALSHLRAAEPLLLGPLSIPSSLCSRSPSLSLSLFAWLSLRASESVFCFKNPLEATFHTNSKAQQYSSSTTSSRWRDTNATTSPETLTNRHKSWESLSLSPSEGHTQLQKD